MPMQSLARGGFSADVVKRALHATYGNRNVHIRYQLLDKNNVGKRELTNVLSGSVTHEALADIKRKARFTIKDEGDIDFTSDRIQPLVDVLVPKGILSGQPAAEGWVTFALGVFLLSTPRRKSDESGAIIREVEAYDQNQVLLDDKVDGRYLITAGTNFITAVSTILTSAGIDPSRQNLVATAKTLPVDREWDGGTSKLRIINDLLNALNYTSLWFDGEGYAVASPYVLPAQAPPEYTYQDDALSVTLLGSVEHEADMFSVPNKWVFVVSQADRPELKSVYENTNANSPTSTVSRGRTIVEYREVDAADQAALDGLVRRAANDATNIFEHVRWSSLLMPFHNHLDNYTLIDTTLGINAVFRETSWSMDLRPDGVMSHECRRTITI